MESYPLNRRDFLLWNAAALGALATGRDAGQALVAPVRTPSIRTFLSSTWTFRLWFTE